MTKLDRYIGENGEMLFPLTDTANNTSDLISSRGVIYFAQTHEVTEIVEGNPMGLLLTLTYPATP